MKLLYPAKIAKDSDGVYLVTFPDFPEAATDGLTLDEALSNASEALTVTLEGRYEEGLEIPLTKRKGKYMIAPAARVQSAILLKMVRGERSIAELARSINTSWAAAAKLENPKHSPTLKQIEKAAAAVGKKLVVDLE